ILMGEGLRKGKTYTLSRGLQQLPTTLAKDSTVIHHAEVLSVRRSGGHYKIRININGEEQTLQSDAVVCATTATVAQNIISDLSAPQLSFLSKIGYSSTVLVTRGYAAAAISHPRALAF